MSIQRSALGRGPAIVNIGGATLFTREDIVTRHSPVWNPVVTSMYGEVDKFKKDLVIKFPLMLWSSWENLSVIFPSSILNPTIGASLFGNADNPVSILARNGDKITYANAQITKLLDLYLGVDEELFAAAVEITALIANGANPEDANAYYTVQTGQVYTDAFAKTNFKKVRFTGAWGSKTGLTAIAPQKGFRVAWNLGLAPLTVDGLGTVDYTINNFIGAVRCIPIQPTLAQLESAAMAQGYAHGSLLSAGAADLTLSGSGITVVAKNAGPIEHGYAFGVAPLRVGEFGWSTTRGFSTGAPVAVATVS